MFRQLTDTQPRPEGKRSGEEAKKMITTQYNLGRPEWQQDYQSVTKQHYANNEEIKYEKVTRNLNKGQVVLGTDQTDYNSQTKKDFQNFSQGYKLAQPLKTRQELNATNYSLGEDRIEYKTAAQNQFAHPKQQPKNEQHGHQYKNYNQRVDIISGQVYDKNHRMSGYEGYSEDPQHRISQNKTTLPQDLYVVDPITGRQIQRKM